MERRKLFLWKRASFKACIILLFAWAVAIGFWTHGAWAYNQFSQNGGDATYCGACHGDFRSGSYISNTDGQNWGNLHNLHRQTMLSGDCDTCHGTGDRFPVILNQSAGGTGLSPVSCMGCHGRSEDNTAANPEVSSGLGSGLGAGLRQHHYIAGETICAACHQDANPSNYTPVGENVLPDYYANPGIGHAAIPTDSCNPAGSEDFAGIAEGLDNDGDGAYDGGDTDCQPDISVSPPSAIDFGSITLGQSSAPSTVTITNNGSVALNVSGMVVSGAHASDFSLNADGGGSPCGSTAPVISAAGNCTVTVTFTPTATGVRSASLDITSDDPDTSTVSTALSGTGLSLPQDIALNPSSVDFGTVAVGSSSPASTVSIANNGGTDLVVSGISLTGADAAEFSLDANGGGSPCGSTTPVISAGNSCTVAVTFSPASAVTKNASLDIASNDPDTPTASVSLTGAGSATPVPDIAVSPPSIPFGSITNGTSSSPQAVTIANNGNADLTVSDIALGGTDPGDFILDTGACGSTAPVISAGNSCTVSVTFAPTATGPRSASLDITSDDPDTSLASVSLTGEGLAAGTNVAPSAPAPVYPLNGQVGVDVPVIFSWNKSTDPDGDPVTYDLYVCTDQTFAGCPDPVNPAPIASAVKGAVSLLAAGIGFMLLGIALGGSSSRKKMAALLVAALIIAGLSLAACGGGDEKPVVPVGEVAYPVSGLSPSTLYYWKVVAGDGKGGMTESAPAWSFTTK